MPETYLMFGDPAIHRIPLHRVLSARGMKVIHADSATGVFDHLAASGPEVRALLLDLSRISRKGDDVLRAMPRERKVPVIGLINPFTTTPQEALAAGCDKAISIFDTPEEVLERLAQSLFHGKSTRKHKRVFGYWPANLKVGGRSHACRAISLSREGAFLQTDSMPVDKDFPVDVKILLEREEMFETRARVIYCVPSVEDVILGGVGLRFLEGFETAARIVARLRADSATGPQVTAVAVPGVPLMLVADDDPAIRTLVTGILEASGWEVVAVGDGTQAVEEAMKRSFQAVLLDVEMPRMNGVEALERIRDLCPDARLALMTGGGARVEGLIRDAQEDGPVVVLAKPFGVADILDLFPKPN